MASMKIERPIVVDHIARIEGKAGIFVSVSDDKLEKVKLNIIEGPRFFERITVGKPIEEATAVFPRICSFCAAAHKITAVQAAEDALGLVPSTQTQNLRELMYLGDQIESHALHLFLLAIPDFLGYHDAFSMAKDHKAAVQTALELKDVGAKIQDIIGSRYIHQENALIGGFGRLPTITQLKQVVKDLKESLTKAEVAVDILSKVKNWPEVTWDRQHLALKPKSAFDNGYTIIGDTIVSSSGQEFPGRDYQKHIKETVVSHSFAKHSYYQDKPFMTGALSRFTLFQDTMFGRGKDIAEIYTEHLVPNNPMSNNFAQAIELIYFIERATNITNYLIEHLDQNEKRIKPVYGKVGVGYSVTEAPRGMVAYKLAVDEQGKVTEADVITPTAMFLPFMEGDVGRMAQGLLDKGVKDPNQIGRKLETIVRSYDPCVSCSVHVTKVK